ncbi:MAG: DegQ family serine endoprotease [Candidatus Binatus sp.]|uniref:DegQ family serine endoprotease n=1 Tax=Candidatus Binatus sp. TaxID=2811406 RepID=UPI002724E928|nr:DegQ family serine endoprotease [Candidatus Binatus sp.]MDO8433998.1 DegQ family serine endoprotease [Candidatus Binatus sp.]
MPYKFFRSAAIAGVVSLTLMAAAPTVIVASEAPAERIWTELADPGRVAKVQTMPDFVELAAKLSPAVVNISTEEPERSAEGEEPLPGPRRKGKPLEDFGGGSNRSRSLGSGFIISKDGYVLTNEHVVENPGKVTVTTQDGRNYTAKVIGHDAKSDVALLKIEAKRELPVAPLGNSDGLRVGEWVMAIGNPFGFDHSVTVGIVSAKGRFIPGNFDDFIQTDASINPGNSGGPLIDQRGQVVGVNSAIYTETGRSMGIGFAIPVNMVKEELPQLKNSGKVTRGWLGVLIQRMTPELAESLGLEDTRGALVAEVLKDGPAKLAGVKQGDVIVSFDNQPINDSRELPLVVGRTPLGHRGVLKVVRDKQTIELPVTITESKEAQVIEAANKPKPDIGAPSQFGLRVKDLSPDLARELGIEQKAGVVISSVQPGSRADQAGLRARDVILEVNRETVKSVDSYQGALKSGGKSKIVLLLVKRGDNTLYVALKPEV